MKNQTASASQLSQVDGICHRTLCQVPGCDEKALSQAAYIASNRIRSLGLPPWLTEMLIQFAIELIKKWMDEREGAPGMLAKMAGSPPPDPIES